MSIDAGTHLASWGYCKGAADLLEVLGDNGWLPANAVQHLAAQWAENMNTALTEKGVTDPVDRLDILEPLDHLIGGPS